MAGLGPPVLVRQLTRVTGMGSLGGSGEGSVPLPVPITVRIYLSSSTGSAASADTAVAAPAAEGEQGGEVARLQARMAALDRMSRRVAKAQQTIVKGVPTPMPPRGDAEQAARPGTAGGGAGGGVTSPTSGPRGAALLASSHASGLHRLARGSTSFSPFQHKRPHPADSEASSSSGSSGGWRLVAVGGPLCFAVASRPVQGCWMFSAAAGMVPSPPCSRLRAALLVLPCAACCTRLHGPCAIDSLPSHPLAGLPLPCRPSPAEEEDEEGDMGADSADARRARAGLDPAAAAADAMPLSPRLNGAKIKPLADGEDGGEGSAASDAMLTAPASALGAQSPAILSPLKTAPVIPPVPGGLGSTVAWLAGAAAGGGHGLLGGGLGEPALGGAGGGLPHSASMEALMMPLPLHPPALEGLARPDSMANLMGLGGGAGGLGGAPDSRNTSVLLGGGWVAAGGQACGLSVAYWDAGRALHGRMTQPSFACAPEPCWCGLMSHFLPVHPTSPPLLQALGAAGPGPDR